MSAWRPGTVRNGRPVSAHARAYDRGVVTDVFAGIAVTEYGVAVRWYERLWGAAPAFLPHETEAVWEIAEHRFVYVVQRPEHAGHAMHTIFVDDLDAVVAGIGERGVEPVGRETYGDGVRKVIFRDPDGNEIGFGGAPSSS
jgi:hypothetical protein